MLSFVGGFKNNMEIFSLQSDNYHTRLYFNFPPCSASRQHTTASCIKSATENKLGKQPIAKKLVGLFGSGDREESKHRTHDMRREAIHSGAPNKTVRLGIDGMKRVR